MTTRPACIWKNYAEALAFAGNSLLVPMTQENAVALDPAFWAAFPDFEDEGVAEALVACAAYAGSSRAYADIGGDAVQRAAIEYTRLFVGPPSPAAPPWETMQRNEGIETGFGEPTFAMQRLLNEAGLEVSNRNNQYADHIGIELLYAAALCERAAEASDAGDYGSERTIANNITAFAADHPLAWIDNLALSVRAAEPEGLIIALLDLAKSLLVSVS